MRRGESTVESVSAIGVVLVVIVGIAALGMWGCPTYNVWLESKNGEAMLRRSEQEKQILIEQARAEVEAAKLRSEAIRIEGEMAQLYPEYRQQQFIGAFAEAMQNGSIDKIIYVPTEANIPIIEARSPSEN